MIRLVAKLSDRLLDSIVPAEDASACAITPRWTACSGLRTGRCQKYCYYDCNGNQVGCQDDSECVC
ncbi:hypothetical protein AB0I28_03830 [Phytomonospora sp. NPDC050363]|uniref:hypothetical protein n=1 Tax=Phytomonospora sp. NPDC050363 TaxID=3155642 RepID=UPI003411A022